MPKRSLVTALLLAFCGAVAIAQEGSPVITSKDLAPPSGQTEAAPKEQTKPADSTAPAKDPGLVPPKPRRAPSTVQPVEAEPVTPKAADKADSTKPATPAPSSQTTDAPQTPPKHASRPADGKRIPAFWVIAPAR